MSVLTRAGKTLKSPTVGGGLANLFALCTSLIVQIASVPILSSSFGVKDYGIWLMMSTIPTYLALSELGLTTAATNEMALQSAAGRHREMLATFQSISLAIISVFALLAMLSGALAGFGSILGLWPNSLSRTIWVVPLLTTYATLCIISLLPVSALRATGHYARGTLMYEGSIFLESVAMLASAAVTRDMVFSAAAPVFVRLVTMVPIYREMRRFQPNLWIGRREASRKEVKRLLPSALGIVAVPIGLACSLQGTALMVGAILGPAAVAVFVPVRTASRLAVQVAGALNRPLVPSLSAARSRNDCVAEVRYWRLNRKIVLYLLPPAALLFALFGPELMTIWTGGLIEPPYLLVVFMALTIILHGSWYLGITLLAASQEHIGVAKLVIVACVGGLCLAPLLILYCGLPGAALSLLIVDLALAIAVGRQVRRKPLWLRSGDMQCGG